MNLKKLNDKVIIVTGASSGIGRAMAEVYAAHGAHVVMCARSGEKLKEIADGIAKRGGDAVWCVADVTVEDECRRMVEEAVSRYGRIDVLICNAGLSMRAIFDDVDLKVLHRLMDVNFWGTVNCAKYALPYLQASHGSLVGISSVAGLHGLPGRTGYSASKFAMTGFLETVRIENLKKGLHVMVACPGFTASNVRFAALTADGSQQGATPREENKMMTPERVAEIVARGIIRRKRLCLMEAEGRATHFVKKFAPAFLDKMFYMVMAREPDSPFK
ncbi:MAG: SDR family oxidoreductase [Alistipes sp.]|nr:SDR family oxidoreductase [Alistipes sp.]